VFSASHFHPSLTFGAYQSGVSSMPPNLTRKYKTWGDGAAVSTTLAYYTTVLITTTESLSVQAQHVFVHCIAKKEIGCNFFRQNQI
jgi:hypothetical protein